jgi:hypothetical protein
MEVFSDTQATHGLAQTGATENRNRTFAALNRTRSRLKGLFDASRWELAVECGYGKKRPFDKSKK